MAVERIPKDEGAAKTRKPSAKKEPERRLEHPQGDVSRILNLQRQVGNRAVQGLLVQRARITKAQVGIEEEPLPDENEPTFEGATGPTSEGAPTGEPTGGEEGEFEVADDFDWEEE